MFRSELVLWGPVTTEEVISPYSMTSFCHSRWPRESVGLSEGQLEHNRGQRELNQASLTRSIPTRPLFYTTWTEQLLLTGCGG
ncbi:unnamed protein product [Arctogadus glacialis]